MYIGVPKEIKNNEYRVGLTPESVTELIVRGHKVYIETQAGKGIGASDDAYAKAGATIIATAQEVFAQSQMIVKVKEPQASERAMLVDGQILFTYLHLAPDLQQTKELITSGAVCIAYETVTDENGGLPLLKPMSQVAGRMSVQAGASTLEKSYGGRGVLLGGVAGVAPAKVLIIGGGTVGFNAAQMAVGMQADVTILDTNVDRLEQLTNHFGASAMALYATQSLLERQIQHADLVIGAVLIPGSATPKLVTRAMLSTMQHGAVIVDVAIDQGGCFETSKPTTHANPTYVIDGVVHYCVANMPGSVARTSTYALNNATLAHIVTIVNKGWKVALHEDMHLCQGLNIAHGKVTHPIVARELGYDYTPSESVLIE